MQLSAPAAAPTSVTVNLSTLVDGSSSWGHRRAEHLTASFRPDASVDASVDVYDPLWDGPYPEPDGPADWHARRSSSSSPALRDAVAALQARLGALDLATLASSPTEPGDYATLHVTYAERPAALHASLRPYENRDGSWTVPVRTSINDLFANPVLAPVLDAARTVIAAAR